ncbi:MAG: bifunctional [glutamate--ammonia ligase]-adenylyl-L-tyrosine phosphorylase/[glutamate--ammonia-ligase] adenylyltransferase [Betaproteobacteria bacterium]|nr:bifunctional [glutamate--ammonia ligase]-adenylyl-L-tyrosine phosphorylase/[glutamate--ammonia-ligase] adenylyltransferase [Betaproteobacteria bacterium]
MWGIKNAGQDPRAQMTVVGMGKLGAQELNVSSDIDLVFLYAEDGEASTERSWHEFHAELGKRLIRSLDAPDADGFVFRVDMRLRPYGASGPLVTSHAALADYFQKQGRPWERYAWLKARAITGLPNHSAAIADIVLPFVYRRYHDYAAINEMRELHAQIRAEAQARNKLDDIKVGKGGIREIEFIVQLHQLIRGGREADLRVSSTRVALAKIGEMGLLPAARVQRLEEAYRFLRNLEHRLQYLDDQQTQALPAQADDRQRIAEAMNFPDWTALLASLNRHREFVTAEFEASFTGAESVAPVAPSRPLVSGLQAAVDLQVEARSLDDESAGAIRNRVTAWLGSSRTESLTVKVRARIDTLMPEILRAAFQHNNAKEVFFRLFDLLEAIDRRETYLALLTEYPAIVDRLARIVSVSAWAAGFVARHPLVMDELVRAPTQAAIDWSAEKARIDAACTAAGNDIERQYELLRHAKQSILFRLNVADIEGRIGVMALSDELTILADLLLDLTVRLAWKSLYGDERFHGFAVIGYGKLGSKELGYASDLDLVYVYDSGAAIAADRFGRLAQRINSWLNTMTAGGVLYETDLRLRPDGAAGLLVTSLEAYADYQQRRAWTWEHQALTRARWCAGDASLAAPFQNIRDSVLAKSRDRAELRQEIAAMRAKMRGEKKDRPDRLDLKNTVGGIVDVEFIVQYLILAYSHEHTEFLGNLGNFALLTRAAALCILEEEQAAATGKAYLAYRERLHIAQNNNERKAWIEPTELATERAAVSRVWKAVFADNA